MNKINNKEKRKKEKKVCMRSGGVALTVVQFLFF